MPTSFIHFASLKYSGVVGVVGVVKVQAPINQPWIMILAYTAVSVMTIYLYYQQLSYAFSIYLECLLR